MKNLSVPTVLAVMLAMSQTATAREVNQWQGRSMLLTAADREDADVAEVDHNADALGGVVDSDTADAPVVAPAPAPEVAPVPPKPLVQSPVVPSPVVKKTESATEVPAPKTTKVKAAPARDIPLIETENPVDSSPDVNYVTGGIGEDEKASITAAKADYNLHVMSASMNGAFVGDARVVITAKNGAETKEMLSVVAGPLLYVKLPAGKYSLDATLGEQKKHQDFTIGGKTPTANVHLSWKVAATRSE